LSERDEEIIGSLKRELEEVRRKKENAIGPELYNYYWEREKKLEELILTLTKHYEIAKKAKARKQVPKIDIEEIRKWLFEDTNRDKDESLKKETKQVEYR